MNALSRDLLLALRTQARTPWAGAAIVISLGLGVAANTTVFAWMDSILRQPFPAIPSGHELVALNVSDADGKVQGMPPLAAPMLAAWRSGTTSFIDIAGHSAVRLNVRDHAGSIGTPVWTQVVTPNFFTTLKTRAALGRTFDDADASTGPGLVVIGHEFWRQRFGAAPDAVGRALLFNGVPLTIAGVMPPGFGGVVVGLRFDAWIPDWQQPSLMPGDWRRDRSARRLQAVGRLKPGITLRQANDDLLRIARTESRDAGDTPVAGAAVRWIGDTQLGSLMGPLGNVLAAVAAIVLVAACMNIAGLQLARASALSRQNAVRVALGASRARLVRDSLLQAAWLTAAGAGLGLLLALAARGLLAALVPRVPLPVDLPIAFGWRVMAFAAAIAAAAGVAFALLPAWRAARPNVIDVLRAGGGGSGRAGVTRSLLIVAQVAFSVTALASAGILIRSLSIAGRVPLGFADPARIALLSTDLSFMGLDGVARDAAVARWLASIRAQPGVRQAALASVAPLGFGGSPSAAVHIDGYVRAPNEAAAAGRVVVSDGYFETMDMPIVEGRAFTDGDTASAARVAVVNAAFAARYSPGRSAVGRRIDHGAGWAIVVGVAADARFDSLTEPVRPIVFHPLAQLPQRAMTLHVASTRGAGPSMETLRRATAAVHPDLPLLDPGTLADHIGAATFAQAIGARVLVLLGIIAVFMAATGVYGLAASFAGERQREIAIAVALGARPREVAGAVAGPATRLAGAGLITGAAGAAAISTLLRSQLAGLPAIDAGLLLAVAGLIGVVVCAACVQPIARALRIDPVTTLRSQ